MSILDVLRQLSAEERANVASILGLEGLSHEPEELAEKFLGVYNGVIWPETKRATKAALRWTKAKFTKSDAEAVTSRENWKVLTYDGYIREAAKLLRVHDKKVNLDEQELFLGQGMYAAILFRMKPKDRAAFLARAQEELLWLQQASKLVKGAAGPLVGLGAIGAAQASGFGIYLFASTSLGALTALFDLTLPFTVYMGLSTAISVILGPVGLTALSAWLVKKTRDRKWKVLLPVIYLLIISRHKHSAFGVVQ